MGSARRIESSRPAGANTEEERLVQMNGDSSGGG
jgi:hypothetical protein